jgi:hypothetical protein
MLEFRFDDPDDFSDASLDHISDKYSSQIAESICKAVIEAVENGDSEAPFMIVRPHDLEMSVKEPDYRDALEKNGHILVELEEYEWAHRMKEAIELLEKRDA